MRKGMLFSGALGILLLLTVLFSGCGYIGSESVDIDLIPKSYLVKTNSSFYTASQIVFNGDPATDFGAGFLYATDTVGDTEVYPSGDASPDASLTNVADLQEIYIAFSEYGLYIGVKMENCTPADYSPYKMALYLLVDNNITSGAASTGLTAFDPTTRSLAGLSGDIGFDNPGVEISGAGGRSLFYLKHWREAGGAQWKPFYFWNGTGDIANPVPFGSGFQGQLIVYPPNNTASNVTEAYIPWFYIFGTSLGAPYTALPSSTLKLWFGTNPTLSEDGYVDTYPDNVGPVAEWLELTVPGEWATLTITD